MDKKLIKDIVLTLLYALITLVVVLHHEIWADEAQVWQLCRHLSLPELFKHLVNEGHPSFFYLLMMPVAKIFQNPESIIYMQIVCWFSSCVAVFLLLSKSPFSGLTKFAIVTSAGFLYFFPVIARSYSLIPMLVFALAILYPKQKEHPYWYAILIAILANIHVLMFGFCAILVCLFVCENIIVGFKKNNVFDRKNYFYATLIAVLGLVAVMLQLCGTMGNNAAIGFAPPDIFKILSIFIVFFMNNIEGHVSDIAYVMSNNISNFVFLLSLFGAILYCCLFVLLYLKSKKMFVISLLGIVFQFFVYIFSYGVMYTTRVFCGHLILIFAIWLAINQDDKRNILTKITNILLSLFMLCTFLNGLKFYIQDYFYNYSSAKETADFVKNNLDKNAVLHTDNAPYSIAVVYYLDNTKPVYSVIKKSYLRYVFWDESFWHYVPEYQWDEYAQMRINEKDYKGEKLYLLFSGVHKHQLKVDNPKNYKLIFVSKPAIAHYETYKIFEYVGNSNNSKK